jgi:hypothetical protein
MGGSVTGACDTGGAVLMLHDWMRMHRGTFPVAGSAAQFCRNCRHTVSPKKFWDATMSAPCSRPSHRDTLKHLALFGHGRNQYPSVSVATGSRPDVPQTTCTGRTHGVVGGGVTGAAVGRHVRRSRHPRMLRIEKAESATMLQLGWKIRHAKSPKKLLANVDTSVGSRPLHATRS